MKLKSNMSTGKRADVKIVIGHFKARLTLPRMHDLGDYSMQKVLIGCLCITSNIF